MFEALLLGVVQGITEFFPISSTAHLVLLPRLLGFSPLVDTLAFDTALHAGTLLSLAVFFWRDWVEMAARNRGLLILIAAGTVPAAVAGVLLEDYISGQFRSPALIAGMLVLFGGVMLLGERFRGEKTVDRIGLYDALFIGFAQALALMPGVSRSGVTIAAGLFAGFRRSEAARFSFLLSMPVVAGATFYQGARLLEEPARVEWGLFATGIAGSFAAGLVAIKYLLKYLEKHPVNVFVYYRFGLAMLIAGWSIWK